MMAVNMKRFSNSSDSEDDEVFYPSPIRHPSPQPRKNGFKNPVEFKVYTDTQKFKHSSK